MSTEVRRYLSKWIYFGKVQELHSTPKCVTPHYTVKRSCFVVVVHTHYAATCMYDKSTVDLQITCDKLSTQLYMRMVVATTQATLKVYT